MRSALATRALALDPSGTILFATGNSEGQSVPPAVTVGPLSPEPGLGVFVTGTSAGAGTNEDYATIAYPLDP